MVIFCIGVGIWREDRWVVLEFLNEREWRVKGRLVRCELYYVVMIIVIRLCWEY